MQASRCYRYRAVLGDRRGGGGGGGSGFGAGGGSKAGWVCVVLDAGFALVPRCAGALVGFRAGSKGGPGEPGLRNPGESHPIVTNAPSRANATCFPGLHAKAEHRGSGFVDLCDVGCVRRSLNLSAQRESADENRDRYHKDGDVTEHGTRTAGNGDGGEGGDIPGGDFHSLLSEGLWKNPEPTCGTGYDLPRNRENF